MPCIIAQNVIFVKCKQKLSKITSFLAFLTHIFRLRGAIISCVFIVVNFKLNNGTALIKIMNLVLYNMLILF